MKISKIERLLRKIVLLGMASIKPIVLNMAAMIIKFVGNTNENYNQKSEYRSHCMSHTNDRAAKIY